MTKKKIRALIFAGGPSKEYQFVKNLFYREAQENRMEVGVYLQTAQEEELRCLKRELEVTRQERDI